MAEEISNASLPPKGTNEIPSLTYGATGYSGLLTLGGQVFEETQKELRWPQAIHTFKKMEKDASISPALELVEMMMARVDWTVKIPKGYEEKLAPYATFLEQCMGDMTHDWKSFIKSAATFSRYGFSINEIVLRYRTKENGSKYNDNRVGIKSLPSRSQDSVYEWVWNNYGRELAGFKQAVFGVNAEQLGWSIIDPAKVNGERPGVKFIPRKKFLHFRNNPIKDNPEGHSPLVSAHQSWKLKCAYLESEAIGTAQDTNGFKVLYLPPQYMRADASEQDKAILREYQKVMKSIHQAKESGIILPLVTDELGNKMFQFDVQNITGKMSYDTSGIIDRLNKEILLCLFADILALGQEGGGSFSLAEGKMNIINMSIQSKLDEIKSQLNHQLVRTIFEQNGWPTDVMPYFDYGSVEKITLDEMSKFVQRTKAVSMLPQTPQVINWILENADIPYRVDDSLDQEELQKLLGDPTSRSGDGMVSGTGNGTSNNVSRNDNSVSNNENASKDDFKIIMRDEEFVITELNGKAVLWMAEDWDTFIGEAPNGT